MNYVSAGNLKVDASLYAFIQSEALPGTGVTSEQFWTGLEQVVDQMSPLNKTLLARRDELQHQINAWHKENKNNKDHHSLEGYKSFLYEIGYMEPDVEDFLITTDGVDGEIAGQAGPQLVVPVNNPRYALNAANARWGSLYDALYGSDVIKDDGGAEQQKGYNPIRGEQVIQYAKSFLDQAVPLVAGSHRDAIKYWIHSGSLCIQLSDGIITSLQQPSKLFGYQGSAEQPEAILLRNNDLHFEIQIDHHDPIGQSDAAGVSDILMEAALTTIMDCEDSVAAVDAEDKVTVYRNWLGLMKGDLTVSFRKGNEQVLRSLNPDRVYTSPAGEEITLSGRSLMFVRNVGHLMTSQAVLDEGGQEVPEGILDAVITSLIAMHDLLGNGLYKNSTKGSVYIVKPKMHGSEEVKFANDLFDRVEDMLGLERHTLKIGVMDEERRTSLNLKACIRAVKDRVVFINTGFLDRTGDEMHTSMEAGPMIRKGEMKAASWLLAYEKSNVFAGLDCGLQGRAQIGKGMWAMPDLMSDMMKIKIGQLHAGANTAWVPSPTAASLHTMHYHQVHVKSVQAKLIKQSIDLRNEILEIPVVVGRTTWSPVEVQQELDNNAQGILGYVVRWIDQGIGCSKVPDMNNIGLMEDRATLRISSQHMTNWLHHGICTKEQVQETMKRMAAIVDEQNAGDSEYRPMATNYEASIAFQAACELVFSGYDQPNGYTEPILHRRRLEAKLQFMK